MLSGMVSGCLYTCLLCMKPGLPATACGFHCSSSAPKRLAISLVRFLVVFFARPVSFFWKTELAEVAEVAFALRKVANGSFLLRVGIGTFIV